MGGALSLFTSTSLLLAADDYAVLSAPNAVSVASANTAVYAAAPSLFADASMIAATTAGSFYSASAPLVSLTASLSLMAATDWLELTAENALLAANNGAITVAAGRGGLWLSGSDTLVPDAVGARLARTILMPMP